MLPNPQQLGKRESLSSGVADQLNQARLADARGEGGTLRCASCVAPEDGWPQDLSVVIEYNGGVHLAREPDAPDILGAHVATPQDRRNRLSSRVPPTSGLLLRPPGLGRAYGNGCRRPSADAPFVVEQERLYA